MTDLHDKLRENDEAIWNEVVTLSPADTKDAKVHVTLRLDPTVYRAIMAEKKSCKRPNDNGDHGTLLHKGL